VVDHSVDGGGGNHGVTEIIAELFEIDIGGDNCRPLAVVAIDDLVKETGIGGIMLLQAVEPTSSMSRISGARKSLSFFLARCYSQCPFPLAACPN
jgi:hypothetical protein